MKNLSQQPITIPPEPEVWPSLTIILPVRNEEIVLKKKLENLEAQEYPIDKIELIVIDSNSSDSDKDEIRSLLKDLILKIENMNNFATSKANLKNEFHKYNSQI